MSKIKTATSALTAAVLVTGIGLAWAQTESQDPTTNSTSAAPATLSEQTPADPNAAPLVDNSAQMAQSQGANTTPPAVDSTTPAPQSSDANSQAPLNNSVSSTSSAPMDNSSSASTSNYDSGSTYEPAPRADRN